MQATSALVAFGPLLCSTIHLAGCLLSGQMGARKNSQADFQTEVGSVYDSVFLLSDYFARMSVVNMPCGSKESLFLIWEEPFELPNDNTKEIF